ncbi:uncharacterized protein DUF402 [Stackebrandtia endophytica]|uniref:Uncharacterized protein DUF402 n=2 Tax=Stackebrandtia endophytica TaxID=1496996 RepID=A0A543AQB4_9ACTN|nr:uncharacterized protein DUF402 [Stackebrandtia endophytica]
MAVGARVISAKPGGRLLWIAPQSPMWRHRARDGRHWRDVPVTDDSMREAELVTDIWTNASLIWQPASAKHAIWQRFDATGRFQNWYVNLEERRHQFGQINVIDHELDILVNSDRDWHWKDEESFAAKIGDPAYWTREEAERIRAEAATVIGQIESGTGIFDGRLRRFLPDPTWPPPDLPPVPARRLPG